MYEEKELLIQLIVITVILVTGKQYVTIKIVYKIDVYS